MTKALNCHEVMKQLASFLESELDESLRLAIEEHLKGCRNCRLIVDTMRKTVEIYCDGKLFELPLDVRGRLHEALRRRWSNASPAGDEPAKS